MSTIKKGLLVLLGMCVIVAIFQPDRPVVSQQAEPPSAVSSRAVAAVDPPRDDPADERKKLLESLQLQPVRMLTEASFKKKYGLPQTTAESGDYRWLYYPGGDFTVQVNWAEKITVNVYDGRMP